LLQLLGQVDPIVEQGIDLAADLLGGRSSNGDKFSAGGTTGRMIMVVDGPMSAPAGRQGS